MCTNWQEFITKNTAGGTSGNVYKQLLDSFNVSRAFSFRQ